MYVVNLSILRGIDRKRRERKLEVTSEREGERLTEEEGERGEGGDTYTLTNLILQSLAPSRY